MLLSKALTGKLIGLARAAEDKEEYQAAADALLQNGLCTLSAPDADTAALEDAIEQQRKRLIPNCYTCASPCGRTLPYAVEQFAMLPISEQKIREKILQTAASIAKGMQPKAFSEHRLPFYRAMLAIGEDSLEEVDLTPILEELQNI